LRPSSGEINGRCPNRKQRANQATARASQTHAVSAGAAEIERRGSMPRNLPAPHRNARPLTEFSDGLFESLERAQWKTRAGCPYSRPKIVAQRLDCAGFSGAIERVVNLDRQRIPLRAKSGAEATAVQTLCEY